ncbi:hypothetical protein FRC12_001646 [Ceratobasidium sp. 428]|nr:hypothetical protein FRC12_001646 [Ceratobasidium sp. 428]
MSINSQADLPASTKGKPAEPMAVYSRATSLPSILVPINLLPTEILSHILIFSALPSPCISIKSVGHNLHPLVVIPSVCTTWRRLALSLGLLWSHVDVDEWYTKIDRGALWLNRTKLWLERAGGAPINFHFQDELPEGRRTLDEDVDPQLYNVLLPHISRAISSTFARDVKQILTQDLLNFYAVCCPPKQLRVLSITATSCYFLPKPDRFVWPTRDLRDLTVLELTHLYEFFCPSLDVLILMLSSSPGLHTLRILNANVAGRPYSDLPEIRLPNLKYIELAPIADFSITFRLLRAIVPGNCALHVQAWPLPESDNKDSLSALAAFLRRSKVVYLHLSEAGTGTSVLSPKVFEIFESVPQLQFLSLRLAEDDSCRLLTALVGTPEGKNPYTKCTSLRTLHLERTVINQLVWGRIQEVVETHQLKKVIIGSQVTGLDDIIELGQVTRLHWLRKRVGQVVYSDQAQFPISEDLG